MLNAKLPHNERTVEHLRTTLELGDLPKYLAAEVADCGDTGIAAMRNLLGMARTELGEDRSNELGGAVLDHLTPGQRRDLLGGAPPKAVPDKGVDYRDSILILG